MSKKIARMTRLVRDIAVTLKAVLTVVKLLIEIVNKAVNCNAHKLQAQVSDPREMDIRSYGTV